MLNVVGVCLFKCISHYKLNVAKMLTQETFLLFKKLQSNFIGKVTKRDYKYIKYAINNHMKEPC